MNLLKNLATLAIVGLVGLAAAQSEVAPTGATSVEPKGMNNAGVVVGNAFDTANRGNTIRPFILEKGTSNFFSGYAGQETHFTAINDSKTALGYTVMPNGARRAFTVTSQGKVTEIGDPTWQWVDPISIASSGMVVGTADYGNGGFTFVYTPSKGWSRVEIPDALRNYPAKVQNSGTLLIKATYKGGGTRSFLYDANSGKLSEVDFGGKRFQIITANERDQVLAYVYDDEGTHTVIWTKGDLREVIVPDAVAVYGWDLNNNGTVSGIAFDGTWQSYGFIARSNGVVMLLDWLLPSTSKVGHIDLASLLTNGEQVVGESFAPGGSAYLFTGTNKK